MNHQVQNQNIENSDIQESEVQLGQAKVLNQFQNSDHNHITQLFVDWVGNPVGYTLQHWTEHQRRILEQAQADVNQRLTDGLNNEQLIWLGMQPNLSAVERSPLKAPFKLTIPAKITTYLDPHVPIVQVFLQKDIQGKLLILGVPGMGKTTTLLTLANSLMTEALQKPGSVLPILFELSAWTNDDQSIEDWLVTQLKTLYNLPLEEGRAWLADRVLLPLLDGLDELGDRQAKGMAKINDFARSYPHLVVCCRTEEYHYLGEGQTLDLRGAVCLEPLTDGQIEAYLKTVQVEKLWTAVQDSPEMRQMLEPAANGKPGILRTPLLLSLAAVAYEGNAFVNRTALYRAYVDKRLAQDTQRVERKQGNKWGKTQWAYADLSREPKRQKTQQMLGWIARQLTRQGQVELLIEWMQPDWLEQKQAQIFYSLMFGLMGGLIFGLIGGLIVGLMFGLGFGLVFGRIVGLIFGPVFGLMVSLTFGLIGDQPACLIDWLIEDLNRIEPVESFQVSMSHFVRREILKRLKKQLIFGLIGGPIVGLILGLILGLIGGPIVGLILGLILGLIGGLIEGLIFGLKQELQLRSHPNQGIHNSAQNFIWITFFTYPLGILFIFGLVEFPRAIIEGIMDGLNIITIAQTLLSMWPNLLMPGLFAALLFGFYRGGGLPVVQHYCLRFVLWKYDIAPWDLPQFLNYCVERRLLQRVGGRYRFLHRELLDYFAEQTF